MVTLKISENILDNKELLMGVDKQFNTVQKHNSSNYNSIPEGYMTAEEWRSNCKKNISEIYRKYEQGLLQ